MLSVRILDHHDREESGLIFSYRPPKVWILLIVTLAGTICAQTVTYTTASGEIFNPERGFWVFGTMNDGTNYDLIRSRGYSLCYANIALEAFRESAISQNKLDELQRAFDRMRSAGVKGFIRITYDNTSAQPRDCA